ncbi:hypothetical protein TI39_contig685g00005 [Zymoseptoria brevis]|uniref:Uncharacterized protein n=1 Tax=Zymoseptoria brevis TaxID=1047168 RepID=A0A0F4GJ97_9PEZI|nr:hypothetical protein TI39_contig685g00005 [Zymoseptoria brevis]
MYYALNDFYAYVHEEETRPQLCSWLKGKAGPRVNVIRRLELRVEMPSIARKPASTRNTDNGNAVEDDGEDFFKGLLMMMHIMATIRKVKFDRCYKCVVNFTVNGAPDSESFEKIEAMSLPEQDRYQGAKFLLMSLMHGERRTVDAMLDEVDGPYELYALYHAIERHRAGGPWLVDDMAPH